MTSGPPPPPYMTLASNSNGSFQQPPYHRRTAPRYHQKKKGCSCLTCICWCYLILIVTILACAGLIAYFFTFYQPKVPSYGVQGFDVQAFNVQEDFSLLTEFLVTVKAENPNTGIGFLYGDNNSVIATYKDSELCRGKIPSFYHPEKNTTMIKILLKGKSEFGGGLQEAYNDNKKSGMIPLLVQVKLPVNVVISDIQMRHFGVLVNCSLVVDKLQPNQKIKILNSSYTYNVDFSM